MPGENVGLFSPLDKCLPYSDRQIFQIMQLFLTIIEYQAVEQIVIILSQAD